MKSGLTLIATGFANQGGLNVEAREKEINQQLKDLKPNEMDTPSFLRSARHRKPDLCHPEPGNE